MYRKGYFLTLDAFIAIGIVVIGLGLVLSQYSFKPYERQTVFYSNDVMDILSSTKLYEFNDDNHTFLNMYEDNNNITNVENTVFEQVAEFVRRADPDIGCTYCMEMAKNLTRDIVENSISPQYSFNITLRNSTHEITLFNKTTTDVVGIKNTMDNSSLVMSSKKIISVVFDGYFVLFTGEVIVWQ